MATMEATFLGVGEACDPQHANTSVLVRTRNESPGCILLDCGFTAAHQFFARVDDAEALQCLWISHYHGDHCFGVPLLLLRLWEMGRQSPLTVIGPSGLEEMLVQALDLAYSSIRAKLGYRLDSREVGSGDREMLCGLEWSFARSEHSRENLALRLGLGGRALYYSGDGAPSPECQELARGCQLLVHESFMLEQEVYGHGSVRSSLDLARRAGAASLALVHMRRDQRRLFERSFRMGFEPSPEVDVLLPVTGDTIRLDPDRATPTH